MATNTNFTKGKNVVLKVYSDNKPIYIAGKNWTVEQNATEVQDDVNGEERSRIDLITNYYSASVDIYQADEALMTALIDQQTNDDAFAVPFVQSASLRIAHNDGTRASYRMRDVKFGPWSLATPGRTENHMLTLKLRFRYWDRVGTI